MKESIYTIPISEVFEPRDSCPICRLRDILEERCVEYITGAAMMEPDVREVTNRTGFCKFHYDKMLKVRNRLSLALILESHLDYLNHSLLEGNEGLFSKGKKAEKVKEAAGSCYVCDTIQWAMDRMVDNLLKMWAGEEQFRTLYSQQPVICLEHCGLLVQAAQQKLNKKQAPVFIEETYRITRSYLTALKEDVTHFCRMFDYRNASSNADWGNSRDSIERAIWFLTSRSPEGMEDAKKKSV